MFCNALHAIICHKTIIDPLLKAQYKATITLESPFH